MCPTVAATSIMNNKTYIEFGDPTKSASGKTDVWPVRSLRGIELGVIKWFTRWRCYAFHTTEECSPFIVLNGACLRDIATFCEVATYSRRLERKLARPQGARKWS